MEGRCFDMNSLEAFAMKNAAIAEDRSMMVFDWDKAAELIRDRKPEFASAGLRSDWKWTGGTIFSNGVPVKNDYTYLASWWAVPELNMDGEVCACYRMMNEAPGWTAHTKWPKSALAILNSTDVGHTP